MKTIPCKECIVLAACKSKPEVKCSLLLEYFSEGGIKNEHRGGTDYYTSPQTDRMKEIVAFFDKKLRYWYTSCEDPNNWNIEVNELIFKWDMK